MLDRIFQCDTFVFDLDGVVYTGNDLIPGADTGLKLLKENGKKILFLTNSSAKGRESVARKLVTLGIDCEIEQVMTSATASALFVKEKGYKNVFVVGETELVQEVTKAGNTLTKDPSKADALLVGIDFNFSYQKIAAAMICLKNNCDFIACNRDPNFPGVNGRFFPGCGPIVAAIETAAGKKADFEIGKPSMYILEKLLNDKVRPDAPITIVGDSLCSDIALAANAGFPSVYINQNDDSNCHSGTDFYECKSLFMLASTICPL
jgi:HAD superfamily hydrolase (TIGR01450 family)